MLVHGRTPKSGIQHSKTLMIDNEFLLLGSCNWTKRSRLNSELNVLLRIAASGLSVYETQLKETSRFAIPMTDIESSEARRNKLKIKEKKIASGSTAYRTAQKFTLARERAAALKSEIAG